MHADQRSNRLCKGASQTKSQEVGKVQVIKTREGKVRTALGKMVTAERFITDIQEKGPA